MVKEKGAFLQLLTLNTLKNKSAKNSEFHYHDVKCMQHVMWDVHHFIINAKVKWNQSYNFLLKNHSYPSLSSWLLTMTSTHIMFNLIYYQVLFFTSSYIFTKATQNCNFCTNYNIECLPLSSVWPVPCSHTICDRDNSSLINIIHSNIYLMVGMKYHTYKPVICTTQ
jgi:hypothetical protein